MPGLPEGCRGTLWLKGGKSQVVKDGTFKELKLLPGDKLFCETTFRQRLEDLPEALK